MDPSATVRPYYFYQGGGNDDPDPTGRFVELGVFPGHFIPSQVWVSWGDVCYPGISLCYGCQRRRSVAWTGRSSA